MSANASPEPPSIAPARRWLGTRVPQGTGAYRWVYVWQWPIRAMHWSAAVSVMTLIVTGFYIGDPYFVTGGEASAHYLMGTVRLVHCGAAGVLVATGIVRVYWLFAGNQFERLKALFPIRPRDWVNLFKQVKFYLMIQPEKAPRYLGHNPLQQLSYTGLYALAVTEVLTGFALYGQANPGGFFYVGFGWICGLLGGIQIAHLVHHVLTWAFLMFLPIHVYLAVRADDLEHTGSVSSIISGGRFVPTDKRYIDDP